MSISHQLKDIWLVTVYICTLHILKKNNKRKYKHQRQNIKILNCPLSKELAKGTIITNKIFILEHSEKENNNKSKGATKQNQIYLKKIVSDMILQS